MGRKFQNILETVGNTPVVRINRLAPAGINLFVKIEAFNPLGSVKDRLALGIIEDAERSGELKPGQTVVEATSGNTGIGLAMVCAQKGYPLVLTMAEPFSVERRKLMRFLGAKVVVTPAALRGMGMVAKAMELAQTNHARNGLEANVKQTTADAFSYVRKLCSERAQFDLIICDPPAFAKSRGEVDRAARGYKDINLYAMKLLAPGGRLMTFSCSGHVSLDLFQKILFSGAIDVGRRVSFLRRLTAGPDHPVSLYCPEGEYLKGFLLQTTE